MGLLVKLMVGSPGIKLYFSVVRAPSRPNLLIGALMPMLIGPILPLCHAVCKTGQSIPPWHNSPLTRELLKVSSTSMDMNADVWVNRLTLCSFPPYTWHFVSKLKKTKQSKTTSQAKHRLSIETPINPYSFVYSSNI